MAEAQSLPLGFHAVYLSEEEVEEARQLESRLPPVPSKQELYLARWFEMVRDSPEHQKRIAWRRPF